MTPATPIEPLAGAAVTAATAAVRALAAAGGQGWHWWQLWRKFSPSHKQGRVLYLEIVGNLLLCRLGQRAHPPMLLVGRAEWTRPTTPTVLTQLLSASELGVVAPPYLMHDNYGRLLALSWVQLLGIRLGGQDVGAVKQLGDHFAEAEQVLRGKLYTRKGQAAIAKALDEVLTPAQNITQPKIPLHVRLYNTFGSIPLDLKLAVLLALGGWRVAALVESLRSKRPAQ